MASSAGGGGRRRSPPATAAPRLVMDSLMEVREGATRLQTMLHESPTPSIAAAAGTTIIDGIMTSLSSAISALDTTGAGAGAFQGQGRRRRRGGAASGGSGPQRRSSTTRRRSRSPFIETVTARSLDDGKSWRKYGQKRIHESPNNPRSYYRCTHRPDQGCRATRQVQASDANPSEFVISYFGQHTCQDPSTIPLVIPDDTAAPPPDDCANLISFGGSTTVAGASSSTTTAAVPPQALSFDPAMLLSRFGYSPSLPAAQVQDYRCGSEEALSSSSTPAAQPVVGSAGGTMASSATVGSAPAEYWPGGTASDMACGPGTGSFPSSPSSHGFLTGSPPFGSFGDDDLDLFGFDL